MVIIKRLYSYMLQRFLPLFAMTFFICLFIVMMQFLWKSIDDLVGKGLEVSVIAELFFYAALTMVPMALPLAVLLASLMVFGNLGEKFELTAMKASGISLFRIMKPLTIFMVLVAIAAFFSRTMCCRWRRPRCGRSCSPCARSRRRWKFPNARSTATFQTCSSMCREKMPKQACFME